jgi:hypothetical protein
MIIWWKALFRVFYSFFILYFIIFRQFLLYKIALSLFHKNSIFSAHDFNMSEYGINNAAICEKRCAACPAVLCMWDAVPQPVECWAHLTLVAVLQQELPFCNKSTTQQIAVLCCRGCCYVWQHFRILIMFIKYKLEAVSFSLLVWETSEAILHTAVSVASLGRWNWQWHRCSMHALSSEEEKNNGMCR